MQALKEFTQVARKKAKLEWQEIQDLSNAIQTLMKVVPLTCEIHNCGLEIAQQYGYGFYDSLAAIESQCVLLISEDMKNGQRVEALLISNLLE